MLSATWKLKRELNHLGVQGIRKVSFPFKYPPEEILKAVDIRVDNRIESSVDSKGHGVQRPLVISLLKLHAEVKGKLSETSGSKK